MSVRYIAVATRTASSWSVERYCYSHTEIVFDHEVGDRTFYLLRTTAEESRVDYLAEYQADRLRSGLFGAKVFDTQAEAVAWIKETYDVQVQRPSYQTYGVEQVAFDDVPSYEDGGPNKTVADGYSTSYSSLSKLFSSASVVAADDGKVTLSAHHVVKGAPGTGAAHELNGTKYDTVRDAERAAYNAGLLHFWVPARNVDAFEAAYLAKASV